MILPNTVKEKGGSFIWQTRPSWVWSYGTEYSRSVDRTGPPAGERFQGAVAQKSLHSRLPRHLLSISKKTSEAKNQWEHGNGNPHSRIPSKGHSGCFADSGHGSADLPD